ncbi:MAG: hypothetical protein JO287_20475 [Pseudonocardiales bacterium]|nr:hypothetical protein [Pseudonocardiales bacterium]
MVTSFFAPQVSRIQRSGAWRARTTTTWGSGSIPARELLPAAFAIVRNDREQILLVRRADDGYWELPG